jgi:hypothetical protein
VNPIDLLGIARDAGLRFTLVSLLPTAVFGALVLALVWSGAPGDSPDLGAVAQRAKDLSALDATLLILALLTAAVLVQPFQVALVRLLEGYWGGAKALKRLAERRVKHQRDRLRALDARASVPLSGPEDPRAADATAANAVRLRSFPEKETDLLPTQLGNVLRAAETRAGSRYGLDAIVAWPRLYTMLPEAVRGVVDDRRDQLDMAARFCVTFAAACITSLGLLLLHPVWLVVPLICLLLAWLAYRAAIAAALAYGESVRAAFDLHRFDLIEALHLPLPADRASEIEQNRELSSFLIQDWEVDFEYAHPEKETT